MNSTSILASEGTQNQVRRNPPARNTSRFWFERFLTVIQRQNPSTIDATFLSQIAPSNEGKLLSQLKFMHLIDELGKPTKLLPMLNMVGEESKKGFQEIIQQAYADLLAEIKIEAAVPDDLVNFFIRKYTFSRDNAINGTKFFLYLCEKAGLKVSDDLATFLSERVTGTAEKVIALRQPELARHTRKSSLAQVDLGSSVHATIEIKLDKDTPKEYWDRVLALLGETNDDN
ncbi:MAG: DUF5343 domain-containing protein [Thaumarchaeota archaeon]|nr:DUF5343 domain-containing protein [Nitrososphaerota archaeon]